MRLLHRYLVHEFLRAWGLIFAAMLIVSQVIEIFTRLRRYADHPLPAGPFFTYLLLHASQTLLILVPVATLMATIVSLGMLNKRRELLAMRTAGLSPWQIALPFLGFGLLTSGLLTAANWTVIPVAIRQSEIIKDTQLLGRTQTALFGQNRLWLPLDRQRLMTIQLVHPTRDVLYGVSLYQLDSTFSLVELTEAASIEYQHGQWWIVEGVRWRFQSSRSVTSDTLRHVPVDLRKSPDEFREVVIDPDEMDGRQLERYIAQLRRSGLNSTRHEINYHAKLALPSVSLFLVLIGIPLGMSGGRWPQVARALGFALMVTIAYALVHAYAITVLGTRELLSPPVAAWLANGLLLALGVGLLIRLR
jgi:lipopolysaccharide export system permease protein